MITALWIIGYIVCGLITGKLASNLFLNHRYRNLVKKISKSQYDMWYTKKSDMTYERYVAQEKKKSYKEALRASSVDRFMGMILGTLLWPIALIPIFIYYFCYFGEKAIKALPNSGNFGLSAAAQDVRKAEKKIIEANKAKELENAKIDEWNAMVDILEENNLNGITKYKKKVRVK